MSLKYALIAMAAGALSLAGTLLRRSPAPPPEPLPPAAPPPPPPVPVASPRARIVPALRQPALFDHTPVAYPLGWRPRVTAGPFQHVGGPFVMSELHAAYHQLIIGTTGSGKSRLAEGQCRGLIDSLRGFCFIDMDGDTAENLAAYAAWKSEREGTDAICRQLVYVTLSVETLPGFDPFAPPDLSAIRESLRANARLVWLSTKVDQFCELVQAKQGGSDFTGMARLQRVLRTVLTAVGTAVDPSGRHLPLSEVFALLDCEHAAHPRVYAAVAPHLPGYVRDEFERWHGSPRAQRLQETESSLNRLRSLLSPLVLAVFTEPARRLDFRQVIDGRMILLVNLRQSDFLSADQQRAIATLFVHEIWSACKVVGREDRPVAPYYLYIDEAHLLMETAGADLQQVLFRGRKYKLSLALIGQFLGQFRNERVDMIPALLNLCRTFTCFLHSNPDDLEILKSYFGYPNLDFTELMQVADRPDGYDLLRLRDYSRSYSSGTNWSIGANATHTLGTSDQVTHTHSHTDGVSDAAGEQQTTTDGRAANSGAAVQYDEHGGPAGQSKTAGTVVNHADGRGTSLVHTAQSSDTTGVAHARGETVQHGTGVSAAVGGSEQTGLTISVKTTVVPKTREEWHPTGRLRASVEDQLHRVAQVIATLRNRQAVVRLFGEDRTFRIDVGDVHDVFPDPREMAARLRAFLAKVFASHNCYFTPDLSPHAEERRLREFLGGPVAADAPLIVDGDEVFGN